MTQELYQKAIRFAGAKHAKQQVPGTKTNYLAHLSNVAMEVMLAHAQQPDFDLDFAVQLALLHDTLEDTDTDMLELIELFDGPVAFGVAALTKDENLPKEKQMQDSLDRIKTFPREVALVKLADRITNLQQPPEFWSDEKVETYRKEASLILVELAGSCDYLEDRLMQRIEVYGR